MMERKLMKLAMMYLADLWEDMDPEMEYHKTLEDFIKYQEYEFKYEESMDGSRLDAFLYITQYGEVESVFKVNIAR